MFAGGHRLAVAAWVVMMAAGPVAAQESETAAGTGSVPASGSAAVSVLAAVPVSVPVSGRVLVAPVQGSEALRVQLGERVVRAVRRALVAHGYHETVTHESLGQAVVACQTPECVERSLDAAGAAFAIVPAIWARESGGEELTLTLLPRSGRSLNASGAVGGDLARTTAVLVDELLARQAATAAAPSPVPVAASLSEPAHPHAWKAGPIILIAGGTAAAVAVGVAAGVKSDDQQLNAAGVAAWTVIGAAAIAGGIAWWVVGEKRRRQKAGSTSALAPAVAFRPTGIDLRLRF